MSQQYFVNEYLIVDSPPGLPNTVCFTERFNNFGTKSITQTEYLLKLSETIGGLEPEHKKVHKIEGKLPSTESFTERLARKLKGG